MNVTLMSWNLNKRSDLWDKIAAIKGVDVVLLQEARRPTPSVAIEVVPDQTSDWRTEGWEQRGWRTAVARLSDRVTMSPITTTDLSLKDWTHLGVSRLGTVTAVRVALEGVDRFVAVSVYAPWERPLGRDDPVWADASAHRLLSDLAPLVWDTKLPVVVSGDWNILYGFGEGGSDYWKRRYDTVFERADAMGLTLAGPQTDSWWEGEAGGRPADPSPEELPRESKNVPTFHTSAMGPAGAARQLDFVFVSKILNDRVATKALNGPTAEDWGPSDHCKVIIEIQL